MADEDFLLPVGNKAVEFHGIIGLNKTAAFIVRMLHTDQDFEDLVFAVEKEYEIDRETATKDIQNLIDLLTENGLIS